MAISTVLSPAATERVLDELLDFAFAGASRDMVFDLAYAMGGARKIHVLGERSTMTYRVGFHTRDKGRTLTVRVHASSRLPWGLR